MVLSFMVVWDLPAISKGISSLQSSRLSAIYNEVAPSLAVFGMLFGKALQAQASPADLPHDLTCCFAFEVPWHFSAAGLSEALLSVWRCIHVLLHVWCMTG